MDLLGVLAVIRRHWVIMLAGAFLGVLLTGAALYRYDSSARAVEPRQLTQYSAVMQIMVVDPRFGLGRLGGDPNGPGDQYDKTVALATPYANLLSSDLVRESANASVDGSQIGVASESVQDAPIVQLTLTGYDSAQLNRYGKALSRALETYLRSQQDAAQIPLNQRVSVEVLSSPVVTPVKSRRWEMEAITFLLPVLAAFGIALARDRELARRRLGDRGAAA